MADKKDQASDTDSDDDYVDGRRAKREEQIPDAVDFFLANLLKALKNRNVQELHKLYEDDFNKLSEKYYPKQKWPSVERIEKDDEFAKAELFLIFYKELYYRHVYSRLAISFQDRISSWNNYCKLLDHIINILEAEENDLALSLPPQWLWDILDEFVYHYQTYCHYRNKVVKRQDKQGSELDLIQKHPEAWGTQVVFNYLHQLVRYSKIEDYLANPNNPEGKTGYAFTDETVRLLGYFSLMQLLRMHSLLGDYHLAMRTIERIDFAAEVSSHVPLYYLIPACHVTLYYYMGFAYLMLRRYADAIRVFNDILAFLAKAAGISTQSYQQDAMTKKQEQMYSLLLLALTLCPRPIDETIARTIRDKHAEKSARLQAGDAALLCFEELFLYSCPKFVTAALPNFDDTGLNIQEGLDRQAQLFKAEVKQQKFLPEIAAYMKLYTAITIQKLAALCGMDEDALRDQLMCVHHKTKQLVRRAGDNGAPLDGTLQSCSDVQFYLDGDVVHINAQRDERPHEEVFLDNILKYQDLMKKMAK